MPVYHLVRKIDGLSDPSWGASTLKNDCWVLADSETDARDKVARNVHIATARVAGMVLTSPWKDVALTECVADNSAPGNVGYGVILTDHGRTITVL